MKKVAKANENKIEHMVKELENSYITIKEIDRINGVFLVEYNGLIGNISFSDFLNDLDIFKINTELYADKPQIKSRITFDIEDLKNAVLNPTCTCKGEVKCNYDGEYSENYYFTCGNCGAEEVLNGYMLDSLIE